MLEIDHTSLIAEGVTRKVYLHPLDKGLLLKVAKPVFHSKKLLSRFNPRRSRYGFMTTAYREYEEYIRAVARINKLPAHLPKFHGFVDTSLGVAMVVEKMTDSKGNLAPNIAQYTAKNGFTEHLHTLIDELQDSITSQRIVCSDLTCENIVVTPRGLFIIDGTSDKVLISVNRYSKTIFQRWIDKRFLRLRATALTHVKT